MKFNLIKILLKISAYGLSSGIMSLISLFIDNFEIIFHPNPFILGTPLLSSYGTKYIFNYFNISINIITLLISTYISLIFPFAGAWFGSPNYKFKTLLTLILISIFGGIIYGSIIEFSGIIYKKIK